MPKSGLDWKGHCQEKKIVIEIFISIISVFWSIQQHLHVVPELELIPWETFKLSSSPKEGNPRLGSFWVPAQEGAARSFIALAGCDGAKS